MVESVVLRAPPLDLPAWPWKNIEAMVTAHKNYQHG